MSASPKLKSPSPQGRSHTRVTAAPRPKGPVPLPSGSTKSTSTSPSSPSSSSAPRAKAPTIVSWPPPPSPGSKSPPAGTKDLKLPALRNRLPTLDLIDDDIIDDGKVVAAPPAPKSAMPPPAPRPSTMPPPAPRPSTVPPASTVKVTATTTDGTIDASTKARDPIEVLDETIGELEYLGTPAQAAGICAAALAKVLGARAVVVHQHDPKARQLRAIAVDHVQRRPVVGSTLRVDDDLLASIVVGTGKPTALTFDGTLPRVAPQRLRTIGALRSVVATPAMWAGSCIAMIEVIDAADPSGKTLAEACNFVATNLAVFLGTQK